MKMLLLKKKERRRHGYTTSRRRRRRFPKTCKKTSKRERWGSEIYRSSYYYQKGLRWRWRRRVEPRRAREENLARSAYSAPIQRQVVAPLGFSDLIFNGTVSSPFLSLRVGSKESYKSQYMKRLRSLPVTHIPSPHLCRFGDFVYILE